jgi:hypothetical protein
MEMGKYLNFMQVSKGSPECQLGTGISVHRCKTCPLTFLTQVPLSAQTQI